MAIKVVLELEASHKLIHAYLAALDVPIVHNYFTVDWGPRWHGAHQGVNRLTMIELNSYRFLYQRRNRWAKLAQNAINAHSDLLRYGGDLLNKRDRTRLQYNKTLFQARYEMYQAKRNLTMAQYERTHLITMAAIARRYMLVDTEDDLAL